MKVVVSNLLAKRNSAMLADPLEAERQRGLTQTQRSIQHGPESTKSASFFILAVVCAILALTMPFGALAQSTFGSVRGTVQDASGAAIPGTEIVLHSVDENSDRTFTTDSSGGFLFENVKAGKYSLKAHHDGFADTLTSGIVVEARQDLRLAATLNVAAQTTTVEVSLPP